MVNILIINKSLKWLFLSCFEKNRMGKELSARMKHIFIFVTQYLNNYMYFLRIIITWKALLDKIWSITWPFKTETSNDIWTWKIIISNKYFATDVNKSFEQSFTTCNSREHLQTVELSMNCEWLIGNFQYIENYIQELKVLSYSL